MKLQIGVLILLSSWLISCGDTDTHVTTKDVTSILKKPPYAGLTDSIARFPGDPALHLQRALLLSQNNQHELASPDYFKSWQLTSDPGVALEYASNLLLMNRVDSARNFLETISRQFPEDNDVKRRLGEIYMQTGSTEKATAQYDEILKTDPLNFEAWFDKAELALKMGDTLSGIEA
ncbi:MAG TPA: tetratricopeptide repeat protein, partial [Flavitalea sp.]|nr:tetratricopeptide repeat protein [Flavitalea sp.]